MIVGFYFVCVLFFIVFGISFVCVENNFLYKFFFGDFWSCFILNGVYCFEVIFGGGWDNLRNKYMGVVLLMNYFKCWILDDGKYFLFDNVFFYFVKESKVYIFVEFYDYWYNYLFIIIKFINVEVLGKFVFVSIGGLYLFEYELVKKY